jgi:RNA polymerase sigma-54 factor
VSSISINYEQDQELLPQQQLRISPQLIAANAILQLSSLELQQTIARELSENPALEQIDVEYCQQCGNELQHGICTTCLERQRVDAAGLDEGRNFVPDDFELRQGTTPDDEAFDPLTKVASEETLAERLLLDLAMLIEEDDFPIAEFLIGSLDDQGYLSCSVDEIAYEMEVDVERVKQVLKQLQSLEPVGIGARNLRECLLLQIDYLERLGVRQQRAREIVQLFLMELGEHKFGRIAHELKISVEEVEEVWEFVKSKLNPHPAQGFTPTNVRDRDTRQMYVLPDVIITRGEDGLEVEVVESKRFSLRINPIYHQLHGRRTSGDLSNLTAEERQHVQRYVDRAKLFIENLQQRRQTLHRVTTALVGLQHEFLQNGIRHLRPLSRSFVAQELGLHESTISRATAGKYVMIPSGEVIPFAHFFTPSLSIKDVIKELIEHEKAPLTDGQICDRLRERGITIARRTVAKYRAKLDILPSALR